MSPDSPPIRDAATVLIYREQPELQVFMVKRHSKSAFMANAMVFPGGRLEEEDSDPAWEAHCQMSPVTAATALGHSVPTHALGLYIAAVRETFEEAGVLLASQDGNLVSPETPEGRAILEEARGKLNAETITFLELVQKYGLALELSAMTYLTRWVTPPIEKRRYDARFFVARAPSAQVPLHDQKETTASEWIAPEKALQKYHDGMIQLAPPTLRILMEVQRDSSTLTDPSGVVETTMAPQPRPQGDELHLILPGDPDYDPPGERPNRVILRDGKWVSIGTGA